MAGIRPETGEEIHRFGDFRLDVGERRLTRHGRAVAIQERPLELLIALVRQGGRLVERATLVDAVWGSGTYLDVDSGLNTAMRKLRRALDDSPSRPRYIETVPRRGYRFICPLRTAPPRRVVGSLYRRAAGFAGLGLALLLATGGPRPTAEGITLRCADETTVRVAVLPILGHDRLPTLLTVDQMIGALWEIDELRLAARPAVREAISPTDVDVLLAASLRPTPTDLTLEVRLLVPETGAPLWQRTFVVPAEQPQELHATVAATVAAFLSEAVA